MPTRRSGMWLPVPLSGRSLDSHRAETVSGRRKFSEERILNSQSRSWKESDMNVPPFSFHDTVQSLE